MVEADKTGEFSCLSLASSSCSDISLAEREEEEADSGWLEACQLMCFVPGSETSSFLLSDSSPASTGTPSVVRHGHKGSLTQTRGCVCVCVEMKCDLCHTVIKQETTKCVSYQKHV